MSFEIPGTTGQVLEGSSNLYDSSGVFCLMVTNFIAGEVRALD